MPASPPVPSPVPSPVPLRLSPAADAGGLPGRPTDGVEALVRSVAGSREMLRDRAMRDAPHAVFAFADLAAWARGEGAAPPVAGPPVHLRGFETRIPGLAARPTMVVMGWALCVAVVAGGALPDVPAHAWIGIAEQGVTVAGCVVAASAAVWGILSEVRGWHGSDAARWLATRRAEKARKARDARRRAICETLLAVGADAITVYRVEGGAVVTRAHPAALVEGVAIERSGAHVSLLLTSAAGVARFDWLPGGPAFEAAIERFEAAVRERRRLDRPTRVA